MIKQNQKRLNLMNLLSDAVLTCLSWFIAVWIRFPLMGGHVSVDFTSRKYILIMIAYCAAIVAFHYMLQLYSPKRYKRAGSEAIPILCVNAVCTLALAATFFLMCSMDVSRLAILLSFLISRVLVVFKHLLDGFSSTLSAATALT